MSMLEKLRKQATQRHLFTVIQADVVLRSEPTQVARELGQLEYGAQVLVGEVRADGWVRLAEEQVWALGISGSSADSWPAAWVLADGRELGLKRALKLERDASPMEDWPFAEALRSAEASGAPWRRVPGGLRPRPLEETAWLSPWHSPEGTLLAAPELKQQPGNGIFDIPLPKLCIASLVRGSSPQMLESLILHHHASGFERVVLYFDDPDDPNEQEAMAMVGCFSRPRATGPDGLMCTAFAVPCNEVFMTGARRASRFYQRVDRPHPLYRETVRLDIEIKDVQARQQLVIEHALFEAQRDGFDWLLHIDADEILFCPDDERHGDARRFFWEVPPNFTCLRFNNLEAVPETHEVANPFQEVSLFKMNPDLIEEFGVEQRILGCGDVAPEDDDKGEDLFDSRRITTTPGPKCGSGYEYKRLPRKERHARRRLLSLMHEIAEVRLPTAKRLNLALPPPDPPAAKVDEEDDWTDDESCYGPRPRLPSYFNSYSNGKAAVRVDIGPRGKEPPPIPAGVHGFKRDAGSDLFEISVKGPGAPVVLHYANCGYSAWRKKYGIICKGHGTEDGAFSTKRDDIRSLIPHLITRELVLRSDEQALRSYYRTFVQGNEFDELAFLAQFGLVLRLEGPQRRLDVARARLAADTAEAAA